MKTSDPVWALGTMSGTSMDGVDAALIRTDGKNILEFGQTRYRPYSNAERAALRRAMGRWPGESGVAEAARVVEKAHAELISGIDADLVGFHGQTLAHDPGGRGTHQVGDGAVLAKVLGKPVAWDFRSADVALGGQGAPLASFYHFACGRWIKAKTPFVVLNLGGIGNMTWVDPAKPAPDAEGACLAFDTGPANAPLDELMALRRGAAFDASGALAAQGKAAKPLTSEILKNGFFHRIPPKSLDRSDFIGLSDRVAHLSDADAAATLADIVAASVVAGLDYCPAPPERILVAGGGRKNLGIMTLLSSRAPCQVAAVEDAGLDGDMIEAQAFGYLAVRVARGLPISAPSTTGVPTAACGGRLSLPNEL